LEKSKFYKSKTSLSGTFTNGGHLYAQASKSNINNIIKIKENFPNLSSKNVE